MVQVRDGRARDDERGPPGRGRGDVAAAAFARSPATADYYSAASMRPLASFATADGQPLPDAPASPAPGRRAPTGPLPAPPVSFIRTREPVYDALAGGFVLDFGGRVAEGSVKNFALAAIEDDTHSLVQFGRAGVDRDRFILDWAAPLSAYQAFAIAMAALDPKVVDTRGYDQLRRLRRAGGAAGGESKAGDDD